MDSGAVNNASHFESLTLREPNLATQVEDVFLYRLDSTVCILANFY